MELDGPNGNRNIFRRLRNPHTGVRQQQKVCFHWQAGRCYKFPCPFLHCEPLPPSTVANGSSSKRPAQFSDSRNADGQPWSGPGASVYSKWGRGRGGANIASKQHRTQEKTICHHWLGGKCLHGDRCRYLHSWFIGENFTYLTSLQGHEKATSGIALPSGSDKLFSGSKDDTVRVWDCQSGECVGVLNLGGEVGSVISEGPWLFVGIPSAIKAWNIQTNTELSLTGPVGQVYAMATGNEMLFAGTQNGSILAWKYNAAMNCFEAAISLEGHQLAVVSLVVGANRLYSGSMDNTIKVWDLDSLKCIQSLTDHTAVVMSLLCWEKFLLSCSLDKTIKVWITTGNGNLEVTYTQKEEHGVLCLFGMNDAQARPVLLCSCNDNVVRIYELPSFSERGTLFSKEEVRVLQMGPGGLFFTGDATGQLKVWKWT